MPTYTKSDYEVIATIGSGTYGTCKKIRRKSDGKILVWKEIDFGTMSDEEKQLLVSEVNLMRGLSHKHIVRYFDRILERSTTTLYIIMEFCEGGDLGSLISKCKRDRKHLEEEIIWKILTQVTSALQECHKRVRGKAILHRDLKPANVFLDKDHNVKLGDFGLARVLNHETSFAKTFVGTPYYMSPELMNHSSYNEKSDIWSMGCLLYELCALSPPFTAPNQKILAKRIMEGRFEGLPSQYSDKLADLIASMLRVKPIMRPSIEELLHHPKIRAATLAPTSPEADVLAVKPPKAAASPAALDEAMEDLERREGLLRMREIRLKEREQQLEAGEKQLELSEKMVKEKLERVESLTKAYQQLKANDRVLELRKQTDCPDEKHPRAACEDQKRKRRVHFVGQGKENQPRTSERDSNIAGPTEGRETEHDRPTALQQRLYNAKVRSAALKQIEKASRYKSKQLLSMR